MTYPEPEPNDEWPDKGLLMLIVACVIFVIAMCSS